jgi:hypothetical protein
MTTDFGFNFLGNVLNVKWKHHIVFRRFALNYEQNKIFEALMKKCNELVPSNDYELAWIDEDGDPIRINSEADLLIAIQSMDGQLLRIHSIKKEEANTPKPTEGNVHPGVQCDLCDAFIIGTRFKCILCADYDLCQKCESTGEHKHHAMLRIVDPNETIVPWGGRLRTRAGACPMQDGWRRRHHGGPFHQPGLFEQHRRSMDGARKKMEETRDEFLKHMESDEWKKTCKNGLGFLNNVGQQIQQALANFGIDSTIESMEVRPPAENRENKDKQAEPPKETPMDTHNQQNGSDVELLEPTRNLPQEPLEPQQNVQPSAPKEQSQQPIPSIPLSQAIPMPAPQPIPYAVPMPPPPFPPHPMWMNHSTGQPPHFQILSQQPILPFGTSPGHFTTPTQAPVPDVHVTATLHNPTPTVQPSQMLPNGGPADPKSTANAPRVEAREVGDWVFGDVYPQLTQREPLSENQKKIHQQLMRLGFANTRKAEEAARRFPNDINAAIDHLCTLSLD